MRRATSWVIHQSRRAPPGNGRAARPICTWRLVLETVPSFSGQAEAGNTTSAYFAVSVRKMGDEVFEMAECFARMLDVGVRHRRVLTHDVHALDLVAMHGVHDPDDGQSWSGVCHSASKAPRTL